MSRLCRIAAIITLSVLGLDPGTRSAFAADLPLVSGHSQTRHREAPASRVGVETRLEEFAKGPHATCTAWTDGCRSCGRNSDGVYCSNVGIACQPSEPRCTRP
jgi:hypothetical protein